MTDELERLDESGEDGLGEPPDCLDADEIVAWMEIEACSSKTVCRADRIAAEILARLIAKQRREGPAFSEGAVLTDALARFGIEPAMLDIQVGAAPDASDSAADLLRAAGALCPEMLIQFAAQNPSLAESLAKFYTAGYGAFDLAVRALATPTPCAELYLAIQQRGGRRGLDLICRQTLTRPSELVAIAEQVAQDMRRAVEARQPGQAGEPFDIAVRDITGPAPVIEMAMANGGVVVASMQLRRRTVH